MKRIQSLQKELKRRKLSAVLITEKINVQYLCGFIGSHGKLFVTPKRATLITDFRYLVSAKKMLPKGVGIYDHKKKLDKLIGRAKSLGFEEQHLTVSQYKTLKKVLPKIKLLPVSGLVEEVRAIKKEEEMKIIRKAVRITEECLALWIKGVKVGMSEDDLEWSLRAIARGLGAEGFSFEPIITFGKNTADVHHSKEPSRLKKKEHLLIDFGLKYKGYCTDMTRVFFTGESCKTVQKIYSIVCQANQAAVKAVKIGRKFSEIDKAGRDVIVKAGYGKAFGHSLGHGVGLEVHESPTVNPLCTETVKPGMLFTIEPGIYIEGVGGVRIEDMVYVNKKGRAEVLTKSAQ
ncbi:aminopeptidase P family protein [Candidatus Peregrinibacteria bacterium]|nr:aminopeptidase P family protein [Candidatus Peregrinibacteria bacterium]